MRLFWAYMSKHKAGFLAAVTCLAMEAFCDLLQPTIMSRLVDEGIATGKAPLVWKLGLTMLGIAVLGAFAASGRNILASVVSQRLGRELRMDLFRKVATLPKADAELFGAGSLVTRLTNDVTQVQNFANGIMRIFVKAPILCAGGIVMATILHPRLATIVYAAVIVVAALISLNLRVGYPLFAMMQDKLDSLNGRVREFLSSVRVVKAYGNEVFEERRFGAANDDLTDAGIKAMRTMAVFSPAVSLTVNLAIVFVLWYGGYLKSGGRADVGRIMAFISYMTQILMSLGIITNAFNMFVRAKASVARVADVMGSQGAAVGGTLRLRPTADRAEGLEITFDSVSFAYAQSRQPALRDVTFAIPAGGTLGIIGPTGCGKTTLVNLLMGFLAPTSGVVSIEGQDLASLDMTDVRRLISVVPQKSVLFTGSISDNIKWGREEAAPEEVEAAASVAQADGFIKELPNGYDSWLGQGGVNLSGGQRQRIAIARALVRRPKVLILDDSTSALDATTESRLRQALAEASRGMTLIIIAQRISSVADCHRILVLDEGAVAGFGTHSELLSNCQVYKDIYRSQVGGVEDGRQAG